MVCKMVLQLAIFVCRKRTPRIIFTCNAIFLEKFGIAALHITVKIPSSIDRLETWWLQMQRNFRGRDKEQSILMVTFISWNLWKQRNARVFGIETNSVL